MLSLFRKKDRKKALRKVLGSYDLPTFPVIVSSALRVLRTEPYDAAALTRLISSDPGLSVRVLGVANSAAYSPIKKIESLNQAVVMLGQSNLESLILAVALRDVIPDVSGSGFDLTKFWESAAQRASLAQAFACVLHPATKSVSFTAGLLMHMAIPLIVRAHPEHCGAIAEHWESGSLELCRIESEKLGFTHAEAGGWLADEWELPPLLGAAIAEHHAEPGVEVECPIAVTLVSDLRDGESEDASEAIIAKAVQYTGMDEEKAGEIVKTGFENATELAKLFVG